MKKNCFLGLIFLLICLLSSCSLMTLNKSAATVSLTLPDFPGEASRVAETRHFSVALFDENSLIQQYDNVLPGETVAFQNLAAGTYYVEGFAFADDTGLSFFGRSENITIAQGDEKSTTIDFELISDVGLVRLEPDENGVSIIIKEPDDFENLESIKIIERCSASQYEHCNFVCELDSTAWDQEGFPNGEYTYNWPFAPANDTDQGWYVFDVVLNFWDVDSLTADQDEYKACCRHIGHTYELSLDAYKSMSFSLSQPDKTPYRKVKLNGVNPSNPNDTLNAIKNASGLPEDMITGCGVMMSIAQGDVSTYSLIEDTKTPWGYGFIGDLWDYTNIFSLSPSSQTYASCSADDKTSMAIMKKLITGEEFDFLDPDMITVGYYTDPENSSTYVHYTPRQVNENFDRGSSSKITPMLNAFFTFDDAADLPGFFYLPAVYTVQNYTPVQEKATDRIFSAVKEDDVIKLKMVVPTLVPLKYMTIVEPGSGHSYAFTRKDDAGNLICNDYGNNSTVGELELTIPWAFDLSANKYIPFKLTFSDNTYEEQIFNVLIYTEDRYGAQFAHNTLNCQGTPDIGTGTPMADVEIKINSNEFAVGMPSAKSMSNYMLSFTGTPYTIANSCIVYSLGFLNTQSTMDLRFTLQSSEAGFSIPIETANVFRMAAVPTEGTSVAQELSIRYNVYSNNSVIYWCNNDEAMQYGSTTWYSTYTDSDSVVHETGLLREMNLASGPKIKTEGNLSFRLTGSGGKYIDSGAATGWYGEYRIQLWNTDYVDIDSQNHQSIYPTSTTPPQS